MATKIVEIKPYGQVSFQRRRGQKNISLRVDANGSVKVSHPWLIPRSMALTFLNSKSKWVLSQQEKHLHIWESGDFITPKLKLFFAQEDIKRPKKKIASGTLILTFPYGYKDDLKKKYIEQAATSEQKTYIEKTYLPILSNIAKENSFAYKSARVKALKSRWGSCSSHKEIVLNAFLAQLSSELIEYVLVHELVHTRHLNHGAAFWACLEDILPEYKSLRKRLRGYQPAPRPYSMQ